MKNIKEFYRTYDDQIRGKRLNPKHPVRAYVHEMQYESILSHIEPGMRVLDAGCGDGELAFRMALKGAEVTGTDISEPNIEAAKRRAEELGLESKIQFSVADAEQLPFPDESFDVVVSSHVLEHLPDFDKGLREVMRISRRYAVVALPTIANPCSFVQVGGGWFYLKGLRSFSGLPVGILKTVIAWCRGEEGVDEGYVGHGDLPHIFRFQSAVAERCARAGAVIKKREAASLCVPYAKSFLPAIKFFDKNFRAGVFSGCGYGTTYVLEKTR